MSNKEPVVRRAAASTKRGARTAHRGEDTNLSSVATEAVTPSPDTSIRDIRTRIEDVFNGLGTDALPGTIIPAGNRNNSREAAEFVISDILVKLATTRSKNAKEAAEKAGVFGNPEEYVAGETVMVFSDPNFSINIKKGRPSKMIKRELVEAAAVEYLGRKAPEFLEKCEGERAATTQIIVSMK